MKTAVRVARSLYHRSVGWVFDLWIRVRFPHASSIFTHMTSRERLQLCRLSEVAPGGAFVEIGSYLGASTAFLAEGIRRRAAPTILHCVDTWMNDAMSEGPRDTYAEFQKNVEPYGETIQPLRGYSSEVAGGFEESVGLLFLDGDHSYEAVRADVDAWLHKVSPGGIVILHDVGWADGVQRVIRESIEPRAKEIGRLPNLYWARLRS